MRPQIPSLGQFSPQCLGVIGHLPLWVAILTVTLRYGAGPAWSRRPIWLRNFAAEEDASVSGALDQESGATPMPRGKPWTAWTLALLFLSVGAAALGAVGAIVWPEHTQLYFASVLPSVRVCTRVLLRPTH
jgi:hypothetical protein